MEFFYLSKGNQRKNNWKTDTELWETFQKKRGTQVREVWCYLHEEYSLAAKKKFCILIFCSRSILLGRNKFLLPDFRHATSPDLMRCISHKGRILQIKVSRQHYRLLKAFFSLILQSDLALNIHSFGNFWYLSILWAGYPILGDVQHVSGPEPLFQFLSVLI